MRLIVRGALAVGAIGVVAALSLYASLPSVQTLSLVRQLPSTRILDRTGQLLYEIGDARTGRSAPIASEQIPPCFRSGVVAVEDNTFYQNPGVDFIAIVKAIWRSVRAGEVSGGASTITQQLARMMLFTSDEQHERSVVRKLREILLAVKISTVYSKPEILGLYLNNVYLGNLSYGIESASHTYFAKSSAALDVSECAMIIGLIQAPVAYDPFTNLAAARQRMSTVLDLMVQHGVLDSTAAGIARQSRLSLAPAEYAIRAPHFVNMVRDWLEDHFDADVLSHGGLIVTTTLDLALNDAATSAMRARLNQLDRPDPSNNLPAHKANNAAIVVMQPKTGQVVALVGSPNYFDASIDGSVNVATSLRQPGSAIKAITYASAFEKIPGFSGATMIHDERRSFSTREGEPYVPQNYDRVNHGWLTARDALATSNNVAAVTVLDAVGIPAMIETAQAMGIHSFADADRFGLALTLGGGELKLIELVQAYAVMANNGVKVEPILVLEVQGFSGHVLYDSANQVMDPAQVLSPHVAGILTDILADNQARTAAFGANSPLNLSRPAAVKTGTTTDWRDNWTVGFTPDLVTGVWVGNANGDPMEHITGVTGAAPIWNDVMEVAHRSIPVHSFGRPDGVNEEQVCLPVPINCGQVRTEWVRDGEVQLKLLGRTNADSVYIDSTPTLQTFGSQGTAAQLSRSAEVSERTLRMLSPDDHATYRMAQNLPMRIQRILLEVQVAQEDSAKVERIEYLIDGSERLIAGPEGQPRVFWSPQPGTHVVVARAIMRDGSVIGTKPVQFVVLS